MPEVLPWNVVVSTGNAWGVTMDCSGLLVMPEVLPWTVVVSTDNAWECYHGLYWSLLVMHGVLPWTVIVSTGNARGVTMDCSGIYW